MLHQFGAKQQWIELLVMYFFYSFFFVHDVRKLYFNVWVLYFNVGLNVIVQFIIHLSVNLHCK